MMSQGNLSTNQYNLVKGFVKKGLPNCKVVAEEKARVIPGEVVYTDMSAQLRIRVLE